MERCYKKKVKNLKLKENICFVKKELLFFKHEFSSTDHKIHNSNLPPHGINISNFSCIMLTTKYVKYERVDNKLN